MNASLKIVRQITRHITLFCGLLDTLSSFKEGQEGILTFGSNRCLPLRFGLLFRHTGAQILRRKHTGRTHYNAEEWNHNRRDC